MSVTLSHQTATISEYVDNIRQQMPIILQVQKEKLQQRLQDLQLELNEERLEQEIALLANKADSV